MAPDDKIKKIIKAPFDTLSMILDERQRRLLAASMAKAYGYGGIKLVGDITGMDVRTIRSGIKEIEDTSTPLTNQTRVRKIGGGRKPLKVVEPELFNRIYSIIENNTYGDPEKILSWTNLSLRDISFLLKEKFDMEVGKDVVSRALDELGYSKQQNQKMKQPGTSHVDRDAQFKFINAQSKAFIDANDPVISVDARKKELIGNFKNNGEYSPVRTLREVCDQNLEILELGKSVPNGVYLINGNLGFVNLGTEHDTIVFAVESIRRWWNIVGKPTFPNASRLYINCDWGGSNSWRRKLWKIELAMFAEETGLEIYVSHFPPGTSKWNKIEHRLFFYIPRNWAGKTLIDIRTIVELISSTTTKKGFKVQCEADTNKCSTGLSADDEVMNKINIETVGPNKSWNYIIHGFK